MSHIVRGFTLIELIAVIVVLAVLSAAALPVYFDHGDRAREAADDASIAGIKTALDLAYYQHRLEDAPNTEWITSIADIATVMEGEQLPEGISISGIYLVDQRGSQYQFIAEQAGRAATVRRRPGGGGS